MRIVFQETFPISVETAFSFFPTPKDWVRLFGFAGDIVHRGDGWYAVPLKRFPIPLLTRVDEMDPNQRVHWVFRGFWRGEGEVNFKATDNGVTITGFEDIKIPRLLGVGTWIEQAYLQRPFEQLWESGWRRLNRHAATSFV